MPTTAADLKLFAAANTPLDDSSLVGGDIDTESVIIADVLAVNTKLDIVSDDINDTRTVFVVGRGFGSTIVKDAIKLNGTTTVISGSHFLQLLEVTVSSSGSGVITIKHHNNGTTILTVDANKTKYVTMFKNCRARQGSSLFRYEKYFIKNASGDGALNVAAIGIKADPTNNLNIAVELTQNNTQTSVNRLTEPSSISAWKSKNEYLDVPGPNLVAGSAIGFWLRQELAAGEIILSAQAQPTFVVSGLGV